MAATRMRPANQSGGTNTKDVVYPRRLCTVPAGTSAAVEYRRARAGAGAGAPSVAVGVRAPGARAWPARPGGRPTGATRAGAVRPRRSSALLLAAGGLRSEPDPERWLRGRGRRGGHRRWCSIGCPARTWAVLHDRRVPGSRANLDHLVIGPSGVWVHRHQGHPGPGPGRLADRPVRRPPPGHRPGAVGGPGGGRPPGRAGATPRGRPRRRSAPPRGPLRRGAGRSGSPACGACLPPAPLAVGRLRRRAAWPTRRNPSSPQPVSSMEKRAGLRG